MQRKIPVIIDTDPGVDDAVAILLALASPELEILAFIVSFGNTNVHSSHTNVLKIYQAVARYLQLHPDHVDRFPNFTKSPKTFLAKGAGGPLEGDLHSAQYFHGRDGLGDVAGRHPDLDVELADDHPQLELTNKPGAELALELLRANPSRSITYIALGPLTTLAQMLHLDGEGVRDSIGRIVCMGGALDVPGNTTPVAEFNFFADPYAVKDLLIPTELEAGLPLDRFILLPLDITTPHGLSFPYYKAHVDPTFHSTASPSNSLGKSPIVHFTSSFLERTREVMLEFGVDGMELHDIVAVWCALQSPDYTDGLPLSAPGWKAVRRKFDVERTGEFTRGMLVVDRRDDQSAYAPGANRAEVQALLESHHLSHNNMASTTAVPAIPAEIGHQSGCAKTDGTGVWCVTETPGSDVLVALLLERVWNVVVNE